LQTKAQNGGLPDLLPPVTHNSYRRWTLWPLADQEETTRRVELDKIMRDGWANNQDRLPQD
jgi:hypothetical protein